MTRPDPATSAGTPSSSSEKPLPSDAETGKDDGLLDSIGKAISSPVKGAAEPEEPGRDPGRPPVPPG